ncbi:MAG: hypothetical protein JW774_09005 [Candidatus Aureabacteria bacterium]|nr:hypothetical protein [Candidatus Auribacterota bacterium]
MTMHFFLRQCILLSADELKQLFFRKRILFTLFIYIGTLLFTFWVLSKSYAFLQTSMVDLQIPPDQKAVMKQAFDRFSFPDKMKEQFPILNYPFALLVYFIVSLFTIPFLTGMISCNMISEDLSRGTQRFLLFRVSRSAYYWSKTFSHFLFYLLIQCFILSLMIAFFLYDSKQAFSFSILYQGMDLTLRLIPLIICFLGYSQIISSQFSSTAKSWLVNQAGLVLMLLILMIQPLFSFFHASLWSGLFYSDCYNILISLGGFSLWGIFFLSSGYLLFHYKKL